MNSAQIGLGSVFHARLTEHPHKFAYRTHFVFFNVDDESHVRKDLRRKFLGLLGLDVRNYLDGENQPFAIGIRRFLKTNLDYDAEEIWLQTLPTTFGLGFNPMNIWVVKRDGAVDAVLVEMNGLGGDGKHYYWIHKGNMTLGLWHKAKKEFRHSPFQPMSGNYEFRFDFTKARNTIDVVYRGGAGELRFVSWLSGELMAAEDVPLWSFIRRYLYITPIVRLRMRWNLFKLRLNRVAQSPPAPEGHSKITRAERGDAGPDAQA